LQRQQHIALLSSCSILYPKCSPPDLICFSYSFMMRARMIWFHHYLVTAIEPFH
jgi:hypothetical protein